MPEEDKQVKGVPDSRTFNPPGIAYRISIRDNWRVHILNDGALEAMTGFTADDLEHGKMCVLSKWVVADDRDGVVLSMIHCNDTGEPLSIQYRITCKNGLLKHLYEQARLIRDKSGNRLCVDGVIIDVTDADAEFAASRQRELAFRLMLSSLNTGVVAVHEKTHTIISANMSACKLLGRPEEELLGMNCQGLLCPAEPGQCPITDLGQRVTEVESVIPVEGKDDIPVLRNEVRVIWAGENYLVASFVDLRAEKEAERREAILQEKLDRSKKLESLGILAGGVAHDLNNTLGPILALPDLIEDDLPDLLAGSEKAAASTKDYLGHIRSAAERAAGVVSDLVTMGARQNIKRVSVDMRQLVVDLLASEDVAAILTSHPNVSLSSKTTAEDEPIHVSGSTSHLSRALFNVVANAIQSIPSDRKGAVIVTARRTRLDHHRPGYEIIPPGDYAILTVDDNGCGIAEEAADRIFDPFFSTKRTASQTGSGLGLSVMLGIVKDHDGYVHLASEPGEGSQFHMFLPSVEAPEAVPIKKEGRIKGGDEHIIVVDDDTAERMVVKDSLSRLGYTVVEAENGRVAVALFGEAKHDGQSAPFPLIVTEMVLEEHYDGLDAFKKILTIYPEQKAIFISAHDPGGRGQEAMALGAEWLKRPYRPDRLAEMVRRKLDA
jgi:PAS domain S-box-containing protein